MSSRYANVIMVDIILSIRHDGNRTPHYISKHKGDASSKFRTQITSCGTINSGNFHLNREIRLQPNSKTYFTLTHKHRSPGAHELENGYGHTAD